MKRNALQRAKRPRAIYITRNVGLDVRGDNHAQSQHFYINGAFLPLGEMDRDQLKKVLREVGAATRSERLALNLAYSAIAIVGPAAYMSMLDSLERQATQYPLAMALGVLVFGVSFGFWSVRGAPWAQWLQDRRDTLTELATPRRVILAEIAMRRARGEWPSHFQEFLRFVFVGRERLGS